jgi:hypothetical protein
MRLTKTQKDIPIEAVAGSPTKPCGLQLETLCSVASDVRILSTLLYATVWNRQHTRREGLKSRIG